MLSMPLPSWSCSFNWPFFFMYILDCKTFLFSFNIHFLKISEFKENIPVQPYQFLWLTAPFISHQNHLQLYSQNFIFQNVLFLLSHLPIQNLSPRDLKQFFPLAIKMMVAIIEHLLNDRNFVCIISFILYH